MESPKSTRFGIYWHIIVSRRQRWNVWATEKACIGESLCTVSAHMMKVRLRREWFIAVDSFVGLDEFMAFYIVQAVEYDIMFLYFYFRPGALLPPAHESTLRGKMFLPFGTINCEKFRINKLPCDQNAIYIMWALLCNDKSASEEICSELSFVVETIRPEWLWRR